MQIPAVGAISHPMTERGGGDWLDSSERDLLGLVLVLSFSDLLAERISFESQSIEESTSFYIVTVECPWPM